VTEFRAMIRVNSAQKYNVSETFSVSVIRLVVREDSSLIVSVKVFKSYMIVDVE
jgi:hypothetical protein